MSSSASQSPPQFLRPGQLVMQNPASTRAAPQLSKDEQSLILKEVLEMFPASQHVAVVPRSADEEKDEDEEEAMDLDDQDARTEKLRGIWGKVEQLFWSDSKSAAETFAEILEKLAFGSRDPKWRIPLGDSGILEFFLEILSTHDLSPSLKTPVLRLIGNSCADTDRNRARVVRSAYLPSIIFQLKDRAILRFVLFVLVNICEDYEPAQLQASNSFLGKELIDLISSSRFDEARPDLYRYVCQLLNLLITQASEPLLAPPNTSLVLLELATNQNSPPNVHDFTTLVNTAVAYLQHETFQRHMIQASAFDAAIKVLTNSYTRFEPALDKEDSKLLTQTRLSLTLVLSDLSALPEFRVAVPISSSFSLVLQKDVSSPHLQVRICACIMLGNLARSDSACEEFVHTCEIHKPLIAILKNESDSQLLHAALGFLKNLALPAKNKVIIGRDGVFDALPRLWALDTVQQVQFSAVSLTRLLLIATFENAKRLCDHISDEGSSPQTTASRLSLLLTLFDRTDVEPTKMEISRLFTAICRLLHMASGSAGADLDDLRREFYARNPGVIKPLSLMVTQSKWPAVRSEGWFLYAIMSKSEEGAKCVDEILDARLVWETLSTVVKGNNRISDEDETETSALSIANLTEADSAPQPVAPEVVETRGNASKGAEMVRVDRENALVLVSQLLKSEFRQVSVERRQRLEDLLKDGGEMLVSHRLAEKSKEAPS